MDVRLVAATNRDDVERPVATVEGTTIHLEHLPRELVAEPPRPDEVPTLEAAVADAERAAIVAAPARCNQHRGRSARLLGIGVRALHDKIATART